MLGVSSACKIESFVHKIQANHIDTHSIQYNWHAVYWTVVTKLWKSPGAGSPAKTFRPTADSFKDSHPAGVLDRAVPIGNVDICIIIVPVCPWTARQWALVLFYEFNTVGKRWSRILLFFIGGSLRWRWRMPNKIRSRTLDLMEMHFATRGPT